MKASDLSSNITFEDSHVQQAYGQDDYMLKMLVDGEVVGYVSYTIFEGEVSVNMIKVFEAGKGYGKPLLQQLQRQYPTSEIHMGGLTAAGSRLVSKLTYKTVPSEHHDDFKRLEKLKEKWDEVVRTSDFEAMNQLRDDIDDLEDLLDDKSPYVKLIEY